MGLFKKLGTWVDSLFGGGASETTGGPFVKPKHKTMPKYGGQQQKKQPQQLTSSDIPTTADLDNAMAEYRHAVASATAAAKLEIQKQMETADRNRPQGREAENLYDVWRSELAAEATARMGKVDEWMENQRRDMDPLTRFLYGEYVEVVSSNVLAIQYDKEHQWLYVVFKTNAWYQYFDVTVKEAESLFFAGSKGGWVWDNLRIRGTVFGYKKRYQFMQYNLGGYQPRYLASPTWESEHAAIPATGDIPENWLRDSSPYSLGWLISRNPKLFPHAKILSEGTEEVGAFGAMGDKK